MRSTAIGSIGLLVPLTVLALDYTDVSMRYADAPFPKPVAAAVSLLTNVGAVSGNPDGTFASRRPLNRAEFVKIALKAAGTDMSDRVPRSCFGDVRSADWHAPFVCRAKVRGIVSGYPDGLFHPERNVNYAEALKILTILFAYDIPEKGAREEWYMPYVRAAAARRTLLGSTTGYGDALTRGEMARLAASFLAESKGELDLFRQAEMGRKPVPARPVAGSDGPAISSSDSSASSGASSSLSISSASSTSSAFSSASSASSLSSSIPAAGGASPPDLPAHSHFLLLGQKTDPVVSGSFFNRDEPAKLLHAELKLFKKVVSLESLVLIDASGREIGLLKKDIFDTNDRTFKGTITASGTYELPANAGKVFALRALMKRQETGGKVENTLQGNTFKLTAESLTTRQVFVMASSGVIFPSHQTSYGRIVSVTNAFPVTGILPRGADQLLAAFSFSGAVVPPGQLRVTGLDFNVQKSSAIAVENWSLGIATSPDRIACSVNESVVSCPNVPSEWGTIPAGSGRVLQLYGNVAVDQGATGVSLQVTLEKPGTFGETGAVRWSDGTGNYNWVELTEPLAKGTLWR